MNNMIDTLAASRVLESAGFKPPQAEALVKLISEANDNVRSGLATSTELQVTTAKISGDIEKSKTKLTADLEIAKASLGQAIANAKSETIRWFFGSQVFLIAAVAILQNVKLH